jgi:hypothetical protein
MDRNQTFIDALRQLISAHGGGDSPMGQEVRGFAHPMAPMDPATLGFTLPNGNINTFGQGLANAPGLNKPAGSKKAVPTKKPVAKKPTTTPKPVTPTPPMGKPQR